MYQIHFKKNIEKYIGVVLVVVHLTVECFYFRKFLYEYLKLFLAFDICDKLILSDSIKFYQKIWGKVWNIKLWGSGHNIYHVTHIMVI